MNVEELREFCLTVKGASESFPFGEDTLVMKIMGKMFAYFGLAPKDGAFFVNLKCDPELAVELREKYESVRPGYHTTKKMWNSVYLNGDMTDEELKKWILHSVDEVLKKLPKKQQEEYHRLNS